MKTEGNIWAGLWEQVRITAQSAMFSIKFLQARSVPARRQRRLFDDTKESEKVMTFLTGLSPGDLASILHPVLLQAGHLRLLEASHDCEAEDQDQSHRDLVQSIVKLARLQCLPEVVVIADICIEIYLMIMDYF